MTTEDVYKKIISSLDAFYNINFCNEIEFLKARCDYFEHTENFIFSKKLNFSSADSEEFLYIFKIPILTKENLDSSINYVENDWKYHSHIGPGHMVTYITPLFICEKATRDSIKELKRIKKYKSYKFNFWGWSDFRSILIECTENKIWTNKNGKCVKKSMQKFFSSLFT